MIISAKESREMTENNNERRQEIDIAINYQMDRINRAISRGFCYCIFNVPIKYEREIKEMFLRKGYRFENTGYSGGVWQLTENICW